MLYQICHGAVSFADEEILHDINFEIRNTEKIAVVGRNGCGKTTLLRCCKPELAPNGTRWTKETVMRIFLLQKQAIRRSVT